MLPTTVSDGVDYANGSQVASVTKEQFSVWVTKITSEISVLFFFKLPY